MPIKKLSNFDNNLLKKIYQLSKLKKVKLYLVGGMLRDILLDRDKEITDFDFCLKKQAIKFAKYLAHKIKGACVILDKERGVARVVYETGGKKYSLDFNDFRGVNLENDLKKRDFTINSIALDLEDFFRKDFTNFIIDPFEGLLDMKNKLIKTLSKDSFYDDPLRILRAFSLKAQLGFKIDAKTISFAKSLRKKIDAVSFERIRDELIKIFNIDESFAIIEEIFDSGILEIIIPEIKKMDNVNQGPYHHLDVLRHSFETLKQLEILLRKIKPNSDIHNYLNNPVSSDHRRVSLLKLAALLHDIGKPEAKILRKGKIMFHGHELKGARQIKTIALRLKLSSKELDLLQRVIMWHLRPGYLAGLEIVSKKAVFRFFRDTQDDAPAILLLAIADQRSTRGPLTAGEDRAGHEKLCFKLIDVYFNKLKEKPIIPLVNGNDLIKTLKLKEGPLIGKILKQLFEMQSIGKIKTKNQALVVAKKLIKAK